MFHVKTANPAGFASIVNKEENFFILKKNRPYSENESIILQEVAEDGKTFTGREAVLGILSVQPGARNNGIAKDSILVKFTFNHVVTQPLPTWYAPVAEVVETETEEQPAGTTPVIQMP